MVRGWVTLQNDVLENHHNLVDSIVKKRPESYIFSKYANLSTIQKNKNCIQTERG